MTTQEADTRDSEEMVRLAAGHPDALDLLMSRHGPRLFRYLVRSLGSEEDAADLAQETFARVYQKRASFDQRQRFSSWLYAIASNLVRDRFRWRARHPRVSLDAQGPEGEPEYARTLRDPGSDPSARLEADERAEAVRKAVMALPVELRLPLILAEYEDKSQAEIAGILKCTVKAIETRIYRARLKLRASLGRWLR
jgi:RNA polymerase sigma-70 factor (ECF subfamily)